MKAWGKRTHWITLLFSGLSQCLANSDNAGMLSQHLLLSEKWKDTVYCISCGCNKIDSAKCEMDMSHGNSEKKTPKEL